MQALLRNVQPEAVAASANAAQALSNLATGLPDSSLFDKWFGGDRPWHHSEMRSPSLEHLCRTITMRSPVLISVKCPVW